MKSRPAVAVAENQSRCKCTHNMLKTERKKPIISGRIPIKQTYTP